MVRVWMQESIAPKPYLEERPGRWVAERSWPSLRIGSERYALNLDGLRQETGPEAAIVVRSPQSLGAAAGLWLPEHFGAELSGDQREEDAKSVVFDTEPLTEPLEIMGTPLVTLKLAADRSQGLVVVRLCDVAPDGTSDRVTYGALNLTHRESDEVPESLEPGHAYEVIVKLTLGISDMVMKSVCSSSERWESGGRSAADIAGLCSVIAGLRLKARLYTTFTVTRRPATFSNRAKSHRHASPAVGVDGHRRRDHGAELPVGAG